MNNMLIIFFFSFPPVQLGVRYRRWRNAVAAGDGASLQPTSMSAGELLFDPLENNNSQEDA